MSARTKIDYLLVALKGFTMGAANVIPGVSGGTIALVTGIYEELINSLKSFDKAAVKLLLKKDFSAFLYHINFKFLLFLGLGVATSIFTIAKLFAYLLEEHPVKIWAFFFGLIIASVYYVGKTVEKWNFSTSMFFLLGSLIALAIAFINPAPTLNGNYLFVFFCGIIGISGMLLPGLSGSYILMLLGNYKLLMVDSINALSSALKMILSGDFSFLQNNTQVEGLIHFGLFLVGSVFGMISFSQVIAWIFNKYKNSTISILTGFVFGSLAIIWPWKNAITDPNTLNRHGEKMIVGYERFVPTSLDADTIYALICILLGVLCIWVVEKLAEEKEA